MPHGIRLTVRVVHEDDVHDRLVGHLDEVGTHAGGLALALGRPRTLVAGADLARLRQQQGHRGRAVRDVVDPGVDVVAPERWLPECMVG